MKRYLMNSGGKDSMASTIICYENGIELDAVVIAEIMFSHENNISAEHPDHREWLHEYAIPKIQNSFGYRVEVVRSEKDYVTYFYEIIKRSKHPERIGKKHGFVLGGTMCALKRDCKIMTLEKWCKEHGQFEKIVGIAFDETERLEHLHKKPNARSVLEEHRIFEKDTYGICESYGLLSPYYSSDRERNGCWFCPNAKIPEFYDTRKRFPELWQELQKMSEEDDLCSKFFRYNMTFKQLNAELDQYEQNINLDRLQMSLWEGVFVE